MNDTRDIVFKRCGCALTAAQLRTLARASTKPASPRPR